MTDTFSADVGKAIEQYFEKAEAVAKQSIQEVFFDAQLPTAQGGRMRVDTGFLRNSLICGLNGSTSMTGPDSYVLTVANMKLGDIVFGGWTADYAGHREFGARGQAPDFYMRGAAQKWQSIVTKNAAKMGAT